MGAQRAWWAVSGSKNSKRQPKARFLWRLIRFLLPGPALTGPEAPPGLLKNRRKEAECEIEAPGAQNSLSRTPFSFLFRGFVSDFSVSGPSEAPVFRDETPEVHEVSLGEPSLLSMSLKLLSMTVRMSFRKFVRVLSFSLKGPKLLGNFGME